MQIREQYTKETGNTIPMFQEDIKELQQKYITWLEAKCGFHSGYCHLWDDDCIYHMERWAEGCK